MVVAWIELGELGLYRRIQVFQVGQFALVEFHQQAAVDLHLGEMRSGHDDVVAAAAGNQLGVQHLVAVEIVVADLDARFLLEVLHRVGCDVVGPVIDVEHLVFFGARLRAENQYGCGGKAASERRDTERERPHEITSGLWTGQGPDYPSTRSASL